MSQALSPLTEWRRGFVSAIADMGLNLTMRQMAILLIVYTDVPPHTVRALAARLKIGKPAITRALDRLEADGLIKRLADDTDKRSILVSRTMAGAKLLSGLTAHLTGTGRA